MYKNQLQELAQRSCFNLPSYTCIREGPDHAPRFKATVNFNGETFESPSYCTTLRQAEHLAAEVALNALASRGPSNSLAARILDETGVYKNLLQEVSQRVAALLPAYTTFRSGLGHLPVFTCTVELAGITFTGEPAKNKKQAEKNAAMAAWSSLKLLAEQSERSSLKKYNNDEQEHVTVARALEKYLIEAKMDKIPFPIKFPKNNPKPSNQQPVPSATSKILPLIFPKKTYQGSYFSATIDNDAPCPHSAAPSKSMKATPSNKAMLLKSDRQSQPIITGLCGSPSQSVESPRAQLQRYLAAEAAPYIPVRQLRPHHMAAPPVTIRNAIPVYAAPPISLLSQTSPVTKSPHLGVAPPISIRQAVPVFSAAPVSVDESTFLDVEKESVSKDTQCQMEEMQLFKDPQDQPVKSVVSETPPALIQRPSLSAPLRRIVEPQVFESSTVPPASSLEPTEVFKNATTQESLQKFVVVKNLEGLRLYDVWRR